MIGDKIDQRTAPCPVLGCGRTDPRPIVLDAANLLGWICRDHRPGLIPKAKGDAEDPESLI